MAKEKQSDFVDFDRYAQAWYTTSPQLAALTDAQFILNGWGGQRCDLDDIRDAERAEAKRLGIGGY